MAEGELDCVILLPSIHFVLKAEQLCKQQGIAHDLVPVPRRISANCGMALALPCDDLKLVRQVLENAALPPFTLYRRLADGDFQNMEEEP
ncbi:MAG: DUF3343 domain-containing protein [Desulfurivibrio sp.]|nr:DUF3343 domain-containing protein [Desulfurivibrio sp.]